ncbi:retropepsin-like aspartic protease [Sphingomonas hankyongi]|uniref:Aspartyl protease family protein n=1 Tax=Sphingomonas hankyongi TaxID=2908209 RepID=A0ABT0S256_9SPHN|nr:aspartyl protease family protein [Sphingomonas hankyongi]MCL6729945.1 aspartyl protease family protein [Sphingomonas hankyongi]
MRKSIVGLLAAAALVVPAGIAVAQAQEERLAPPKVTFLSEEHMVPFELFRGNRVVAPGKINGHATQMILDTGASATTVDRAFARSIGLPEGRKVDARGAGGVVEAEIVPNVTLEVGGMRFENMTVAVMDLQPVARAIGRPMNIVLGREFFNSAVVSIDWGSNRLRVSSHAAFKPAAASTAVALTKRGPFNTIPIAIAGAEPIPALLDLGNGGALSLPRSYWGKRADLSGLRYAESRLGGVGGLHPARVALIPSVQLAGTTVSAVPATLSDSGNDEDPEKMANVGIGLLKQFHVDLDLGRDRIYLAPRKDASPFDRDRSGTRLDLAGDRLKVAFISPQGPAKAAGLKEGDEIVAVDGRKVTADYYSRSDWTRGPAGEAVTLERADGTKVTVTLQDYY